MRGKKAQPRKHKQINKSLFLCFDKSKIIFSQGNHRDVGSLWKKRMSARSLKGNKGDKSLPQRQVELYPETFGVSKMSNSSRLSSGGNVLHRETPLDASSHEAICLSLSSAWENGSWLYSLVASGCSFPSGKVHPAAQIITVSLQHD